MSNTSLPQRYRSRYTGIEIDEILTSVGSKIGSEIITTDINNGDIDRVPAASITKYLNERIEELNDPYYLLNIWMRLPDNNQFTDAHADKLDKLNDQFKGSFLTEAIRAETLETRDFLGGELTFIINAGNNISRFDWFNANTRQWVPARFITDGTVDPINVPVPASIQFTGFDTSKNTSAKIIVSAKTGNRIKVIEALVTTNGIDTFLTQHNVAGTDQHNAFDLFDILPELNPQTGIVNIFIVTKVSNMRIHGKVVAEV